MATSLPRDLDRTRHEPAVWSKVADLAVFAASPIVPVRVAGQALLLVRDGNGVFAVERTCPHEGADLAKGLCKRGRLHCPHHQASFALIDGSVSPGWSFRRLRTFAVQVIGREIYVDAADIARLSREIAGRSEDPDVDSTR